MNGTRASIYPSILGAWTLVFVTACPSPPEHSPAKSAPAKSGGNPSTVEPEPERVNPPAPALTDKPKPSLFIDAVGLEAEPEACYAYANESCRWLTPAKPDCETEVQGVLVKAKIDAGVCAVALKSLAQVDASNRTVKSSAAARFLQEALLTSPDVDLAAARAAMAKSPSTSSP